MEIYGYHGDDHSCFFPLAFITIEDMMHVVWWLICNTRITSANPHIFISSARHSSLARSTTLTLAMAITPTRWHFAAHMGQLLRYTGDSLTGPTGCSQLWPQCPFSSQKLMRLSSKMSLKWWCWGGGGGGEGVSDWQKLLKTYPVTVIIW